ncbi:hypothetical protein ACFQ60_18920 [Streptomyces zhihengii]
MKISFLIHTVYGIGGTIRTTLNLAEELANRHEVEIVSVFRHRDDAAFALDPRLSVVPLVDIREGSEDLRDPLISQPATVFPGRRPATRSTAGSPTNASGPTTPAATPTSSSAPAPVSSPASPASPRSPPSGSARST